MQIWQEEDVCTVEENGGCCGLSAVEDARRVAAALGIPYYVMNFREEFQKNVIDYFADSYVNGQTPNPCIACNRYVKWEALLKRSISIGADFIATGHYARVEQLSNGRYALRRSATAAKDQTYALYNLTQEQLKRTLMPVGEYTKEEVRVIAEKIGLLVADKPDSQDICFVQDGNYAAFIEEHTGKKASEGNFVTSDGTVIGRHKGIIHYTVGQRKGLGLALEKPLISIPTTAAIAYNIWDTDKFVCPIMDARRNQVYTGVYCYTDHRLDTVWEQDTMSIEALAEGLNCLDHEVIFLGDGVAVYREKLEALLTIPFSFAPAHVNRQRAAAVGALAEVYYKEGKIQTAEEHEPEYLRKSQAERERAERESVKHADVVKKQENGEKSE